MVYTTADGKGICKSQRPGQQGLSDFTNCATVGFNQPCNWRITLRVLVRGHGLPLDGQNIPLGGFGTDK